MPTGVSVAVSPALGGHAPAAAAAPTLASPAFTAVTSPAVMKEGDADMITWPASKPLVVDSFGKMLLWIQYLNNANSTKYHIPVVSNDNGATWIVPTLSGFNDNTLGDIVNIRGADCHDATNDQFIRVVALTQVDGGVYVRFLTPTRDVSNNITALTRTRQMQLDAGVSGELFECPFAFMVGTKFHAGWSALNGAHAGGKAEIRMTSLVPVKGAADVVAANWTAPLFEASGAGATDTIGDQPQSTDPPGTAGPVKYSILAKSSVNGQPYCAVEVLTNGDLGIAYAMGGTGGAGGTGSFYWNKAVWSAGNADWRTGLASALTADAGQFTISAMNISGSGGDALKNQRLSKIAVASSTQALVTLAAWSGTADVVYAALINPTAGSLTSLTSVYDAGGAHSYAATTDAAWDATAARFLTTYIKTATKNSFFKTWTAAMAAGQGETSLHATDIDEPYVYQGRINGKSFFYDRRTTAGTLPDKYPAAVAAGVWS
jgi:hypothetical protein